MDKFAFIAAILLSSISLHAEDPAPGKQVEQSLANGNGTPMLYLLYLPKDYRVQETNWPVLLFLRGRGESDGPLSIVKKWGPPRAIERGENLPYIVVSPQCPREDSWNRPT